MERVHKTNMRMFLKINFTDANNDKYDYDFCKRLKYKCVTQIPANSTVFLYYSFYMNLLGSM